MTDAAFASSPILAIKCQIGFQHVPQGLLVDAAPQQRVCHPSLVASGRKGNRSWQPICSKASGSLAAIMDRDDSNHQVTMDTQQRGSVPHLQSSLIDKAGRQL